METMYYVDFTTHNGKTSGWNYKQTKQFASLDAAKKEFHNILSTYIEYGDLDLVTAVLWDSYGNMRMTEFWQKEQPAPEPNEE